MRHSVQRQHENHNKIATQVNQLKTQFSNRYEPQVEDIKQRQDGLTKLMSATMKLQIMNDKKFYAAGIWQHLTDHDKNTIANGDEPANSALQIGQKTDGIVFEIVLEKLTLDEIKVVVGKMKTAWGDTDLWMPKDDETDKEALKRYMVWKSLQGNSQWP